MKKRIAGILIIFIAAGTVCYGYDQAIPLDASVVIPDRPLYVEYEVNLDLKPRQETLDHVLGEIDNFVTLGELPVNMEKNESEYWVFLPVVNTGEDEKVFFAELGKGFFWKAYLFVLDDEGHLLQEESYSVLRDNFNRNEMLPRVSFPFSIGPGERKQLVLRMKAYDIKKVPIRLVDMERHMRSVFTVHVLIGIFFGILGGLLIYNGVLYFSMRERWLLLYLIAVVTAGMYILVSSRIIFLFYDAPSIFAAFTVVLVLLFTRSFLQTKEKMKSMNVLLLVHAALISFDIVAFPLINANIFFTLHNYFIISSMAVMMIVGAAAVLKKIRFGRVFLAGFTLFCLGAVTSVLNEHGVRYGDLTFVFSKAEQPGFVFSLLILAFAVSGRIRTLRREKEAAEERIGFFTGISHELRTPLTNLQLPLERIIRGDEGEKISSENSIFRQMYRQTKRLHRHVDNMLTISRFESSVMKLKPEQLDPVRLCREYMSEFRSAAEKKGVELRFLDSIGEGTRIRGDLRLFESAVLNVLDNAVKFTPSGTVTLSLEAVEKRLRITVTDTGEGIPPGDIDKVLTKYYAAGSSRGFGIGLALVKEIVTLHGGEIEIVSTPESGTSVALFFPADARDDKNTAGPEEVRSVTEKKIFSRVWEGTSGGNDSEGGKHPVLVVEDDPDLSDSLKRLLSPRFRVAVAANGEEGLKRLERETPELIVSDVMMPKMDGFEFIKNVRGRKETGSVPFVFLTALSSHEDVIEGLQYGAVAYVRKPFDGEEFIEKVTSLITSRQRFMRNYNRKFKEYLNRWDPFAESAPPRGAAAGEDSAAADFQESAERYGLTDKQTEIFELVVKGYTNKEIADFLNSSKKTVDNHVSAILKKTGVSRRTQLSFELLQGE